MGKLTERLKDAKRSGVYRATRADELEDAARGTAHLVTRIAGEDKEALLANIAAALAFPPWFGGNWDALEDCLTDLSWRAAPGYVLIFDGDIVEPGALVDVLRAAAGYWAGRERPFFAVFIDPQRRLALPDLFRER
jgi:hypothetical protein